MKKRYISRLWRKRKPRLFIREPRLFAFRSLFDLAIRVDGALCPLFKPSRDGDGFGGRRSRCIVLGMAFLYLGLGHFFILSAVDATVEFGGLLDML